MNSSPKYLIDFKGPLAFYENTNDGYIPLEKADEKKNYIRYKFYTKQEV